MRTLLAVLAIATASAADFTVGDAVARPGQKAYGYLNVPSGADAAEKIPVIVLNGTKPGPSLALIAGAHGTEYASIIALEKLAESVDPAEISGTLVIVPLLNLGSFLQKVPHVNPVDAKNMNRFYPGKADGTQTERASSVIAKQVVERCDYLIDFHGGDLDENLRKYAYWADTGNPSLDATTRGMVLAFGLDHIIIQHNRPTDPNPSGAVTITRYAQRIGKPAITVEAGHAGTVEAEDVDALMNGTRNVMRHLKMLPGSVKPVEHPLWIANVSILAGQEDGIFYPLALPEAYVTAGMPIGYVTNFFGEKIQDIASPVSGIILYIGAVPSLKKGDTVAHIGEIGTDPKH